MRTSGHAILSKLFVLLLVVVLSGAGHFGELYAQARGRSYAPAKRAASRKVVLHSVTIKKRKYLYLREIAALYGCKYTYTSSTKTAVMTGANNLRLEFKRESVSSKINGVAVAMSFPVIMHKNRLMLAVSDFQDLLHPIMRPSTVSRRTINSILIDPGHGGKDTGARYGGVEEKDYNLIIARRVGSILIKRGYKVIYTRTTDKELSLAERSTLAAKHKPDLFLSIHCNAASATSVSGIEVFVANPAGVPSYGTSTVGKKAPGTTAYNPINAVWAYKTQAALIKATQATDRGVKRKQFYVLRETPAPAMLIECGFLSNAAERKKLGQSAYLDKLAVAICDGVDETRRALAPVSSHAPAPPKKR